jgi:CelD/BcsL family acetyltransferase involved in cellulose biosynthesis
MSRYGGFVVVSARFFAPAVTARIIDNSNDWDTLYPHWAALFDNSLQAAPPLRFAWLRNWWRHYGSMYRDGKSALRILTFWRGIQMIGALPLYKSVAHSSVVSAHRIGFISTGEDEAEETRPDYLNLMCLAGEEAACLNQLRKTLRRVECDFLELLDLPGTSPLLADHGWWDGQLDLVPTGHCPIANLQGGFDAYLARLSSHNRKNARRVLRLARQAGATLEIAAAGNTDEFFNDLVRLHQSRWKSLGEPGCFSAARFEAFHRSLAQESIPAGHAALARLRIQGRSVAALYGFRTESKFDLYQSGIETTDTNGLPSPGIAANLMLMAHLQEQGVNRYDFLRGQCQYKNSLATEQCPLYALRAWKQTSRAMAFRSCRFIARAIKGEVTIGQHN